MRKKAVVALLLAFVMAFMPLTAFASTYIPEIRVEDEVAYIPLRIVAYALNAEVAWDRTDRAAVITCRNGEVHRVVIEDVGGFIENGVSWVPVEFAVDVLLDLLGVQQGIDLEIAELLGLLREHDVEEPVEPDPEVPIEPDPEVPTEPDPTGRVERIDLTLWDAENFADVREAAFSTDLPHGEIAVNYIEYMSDNLGARSAFTYRELEAAVWIVEELLAMGHYWGNISIQEFTYWEANDMGLGLWGNLNWNTVTSPHILGVGREYQLRPDRVSQNVVLTIPGQSQRKIVVGAHYDSPPYASASDNASGTALLLESAQRMLELNHYYTIVYVFFGAEEVGLIGAYYYHESLSAAQRDNIVMMVNADVIIEGPYIIYGAGSAPVMTDELLEEITDILIDELMEYILWDFETILAELDEMGIEDPFSMLPFDSLDEYIELVRFNIATIPSEMLLLETAMMGLIDPIIDPVAAQVSAIAAQLNEDHDFEILSIPSFVAGPSDHLVFLMYGHTVVNFVGLERLGVLDADFVAQLTRYGEMAGDFTATILHTPLDEFHFIEYMWPGMMNANLEALSIFLEAILTGRFS